MTNKTPMRVRNPDTLLERLRADKDTSGLSWRKWYAQSDYQDMPLGTLNAIYNGYPIPKKYLYISERVLSGPPDTRTRHRATVDLDPETIARLDAAANALGLSRSAWMRATIEDKLNE